MTELAMLLTDALVNRAASLEIDVLATLSRLMMRSMAESCGFEFTPESKEAAAMLSFKGDLMASDGTPSEPLNPVCTKVVELERVVEFNLSATVLSTVAEVGSLPRAAATINCVMGVMLATALLLEVSDATVE